MRLSYLVCVAEQKDKTEPFDVEEVVQEMPREQRQTLWGKLASLLQDVLQELPPERWEDDREEGMEVESAVDPVSYSINLKDVKILLHVGFSLNIF